MALYGAPVMAFAVAWRIAHVVKTVVGLPMHVAIVNGLNRKLGEYVVSYLLRMEQRPVKARPYSVATTKPLHLLSFRGEVKSADDPASPDSAIVMSALALKRSTAM